ncbi:MAG TPA: hypothetical protein VFI43_03660 [Nitrosospira sp.]|nr:hypothetical protein [Nitrosospira sp.]
MAIGWMTALKIIPWSNVLESAPHIVKAAKHLFAATKADRDNFTTGYNPPPGDDITPLNRRIQVMEAKIAELREEQKSSAELIKSLAEQNAFVVEAFEVLRLRLKMLLVVCVLLCGALAGLIVWLATR